MKQPNEKQRMNKPSTLLSQDENDLVFSLLGRRCQAMSTAVVQLFTTEAPAHSAWSKRLSGIACFVRDSSKRSYFIRVYCMAKHELVWEEEMYDTIVVGKPREFLINFEGQDCMVALSFASDAEANIFYRTVTATIANRSKKRRSRKFSPTKIDGSQDTGYDSGVVLRNQNSTGMTPFSQMSQSTIGIRDKKRPNRKLTKADISQPTNFKHLAHVGWNDSKHFELNNEDVNNLDTFLKKAGVSEQQLNDRDTRAYIYDFIQSHNVLDSVKLETQQSPPPVPTRNNPTQRIAPPPPPSANVSKPPAQLPKQSRTGPPGRPPPISDPQIQQSQAATTVHIPAPPPPPPPPPLNTLPSLANQNPVSTPAPLSVPAAPDPRGALMDSIRKGTTLRKVDPAALSTGSGSGDARSELLSEIRQGIELKPVEQSGQRDSCNRGTDALADALRRALQERSRVLRSSDEEEDTSDNEEWDD
ncbi:actin nucleation-promoting factor WASL-like isoform X2 [Sitodiplosis mosellana]|uniref:actin nucleation-promoting factor WASL-like isoform X2 n=1 Tax=Sitodiplosis mosellana TaxID=263140 RepID=UPI002444C99C|nr:actin nucleation-promoting factor WASL-like isoform X2 [Sitodiplosis mosellana]